MPLVRERQFNLINFLYSIGTVILLVAALFMVLEWEHARTLFGVGLFIEIVVFVISLIDKETEDPGYTEEIVFPPVAEKVVKKKAEKLPIIEPKLGTEDHLKESLKELSASINALHTTTKSIVHTVDQLQEDYEKLIETSEQNSSDLKLLKQRLDNI